MDLSRAIEALYASNDPLIEARTKAVLEAAPAPDAILEALAAQQNEDGGWPLNGVQGQPSSIEDTTSMLLLLLELDEQGHAMVEQAERWLVARQAPRGWLREPQDLIAYQPPLWADPESDAALVYSTARAATVLVLLGGHDLVLDGAVMWLQSQLGGSGLLPGFRIVTTAWALPACVHFTHQETRPIKRMISGLGDALSPEWDASLAGTTLTCLSLARFPRSLRLTERVIDLLSAQQRPDGTWLNDAEQPDLSLTLQIVRAARRFGLR